MNIDKKNLLVTAKKILEDNWKVNHSVPSSKLYQEDQYTEDFSSTSALITDLL